MTTAIWLGASYVLGRDVPVDEPYPHVCRAKVVGRMTGVTVRLSRKECAACLIQMQTGAANEAPNGYPPVDPAVRTEEARRLGEHD